MEIKLSAGDKIQVPTGCKATIKDNQIIIKEEFKDGDILYSKETDKMLIFKSYDDDDVTFSSYYNNSHSGNSKWGEYYFRRATEEEKQHFFDELKAKGLKWDSKTKEIKEIRNKFKDGDILSSRYYDKIVIFSNYTKSDNSTFESYYNNANDSNKSWFTEGFCLATNREKEIFFDRLEANGLQWNAETKTMEKIRKRAKIGEFYLYIGRDGEVFEEREGGIVFDNKNYKSGNYYLLEEREQAEEDAKAIKAIFEKRLKI